MTTHDVDKHNDLVEIPQSHDVKTSLENILSALEMSSEATRDLIECVKSLDRRIETIEDELGRLKSNIAFQP